jgi:hypothetical protein
MTIKVHIDRLVLEGIPVKRNEVLIVQQAVEKELSRLLLEGGISEDLALGGAIPVVPSGEMRVSGTGAQETGKGIARAVYGGIGR